MSIMKKFGDMIFGPDEEFEEGDFVTADTDEKPVAPKIDPKKNKVININATTQMKVVVIQLKTFEETREIADHLKAKKPVVINLELIDKDVARRVIDFVSGSVYALDGSIQKITNGIFLVAPYNVGIMGDVKDELRNNGVFNWTL